jgi:mRNA-degrading endonuclease toxin of MazEF toxin-antitoxin module
MELIASPGAVVWAWVGHPLEDPHSAPKIRPVVLIRRVNGHWLVCGLTTSPAYRSGEPRTPIPNPRSNGLSKPGWLWCEQVTSISAIDVDEHIGWVDQELVTKLRALRGVYETDIQRLRHVAARSQHDLSQAA